MSESRPRDLTAEELVVLRSPAARGKESAPLRIPPGTQIAIELLNPAAEVSDAAAPTYGLNEAAGAESGGGPEAAPTGVPPARR
jgi:hypothetical protein